jgi:hypothetical protein
VNENAGRNNFNGNNNAVNPGAGHELNTQRGSLGQAGQGSQPGVYRTESVHPQGQASPAGTAGRVESQIGARTPQLTQQPGRSTATESSHVTPGNQFQQNAGGTSASQAGQPRSGVQLESQGRGYNQGATPGYSQSQGQVQSQVPAQGRSYSQSPAQGTTPAAGRGYQESTPATPPSQGEGQVQGQGRSAQVNPQVPGRGAANNSTTGSKNATNPNKPNQ